MASIVRPGTYRFPVPSVALLRAFSRSFSSQSTRYAPPKQSSREKAAKEKAKRKRKRHVHFKQYPLEDMEQFALCDAMRYIRAFEVGRPTTSPKYECAVKLRTKRDGPVIKSSIRLPHSVKTDMKVVVICPPNSPAARQAKAAGAALVGEEEVFEVIKNGKIDFDRCIAQPASLPKMNKEGLGKILGPRGLMPSVKLGTVVEGVANAVKNMLGGSLYRERLGVVRLAIGQLGFTPEQLRDNIKAFVAQLKKDAAGLDEQGKPVLKDVHEVVLSSTNSPGFSLNGEFKSELTPPLEQLRAAS